MLIVVCLHSGHVDRDWIGVPYPDYPLLDQAERVAAPPVQVPPEVGEDPGGDVGPLVAEELPPSGGHRRGLRRSGSCVALRGPRGQRAEQRQAPSRGQGEAAAGRQKHLGDRRRDSPVSVCVGGGGWG